MYCTAYAEVFRDDVLGDVGALFLEFLGQIPAHEGYPSGDPLDLTPGNKGSAIIALDHRLVALRPLPSPPILPLDRQGKRLQGFAPSPSYNYFSPPIA